jgi:hypothetical protein
MTKVEVNDNNLRHCRCPECPVEKASACSMKKLENDPVDVAADPITLARLYCSAGKTDCDDMDTRQSCQCPTCLVWEENDLSSTYYCTKGKADEIG